MLTEGGVCIKSCLNLLKLCVYGLITGVFGGLIGAAFVSLLTFVTGLRETSSWLILLLPLGSIITVIAYRAFGVGNHAGTNEIVLHLKNQEKIKGIIAPLIFISTAITQLFGGSAGKEGAALQLGGAGSSAISRLLKLKGDEQAVFIMSGMSATFAGVFGTPFTAAFFILEFKSRKKILSLAVLPCFISAIVAKQCVHLLNVTEEGMHLTQPIAFSISGIGKVLVLAIAISLVGVLVCFAFENIQFWIKKAISNPFTRALIFSFAVVVLTICVGNMRYNGSGMDVIVEAISGNANWYDFILKLVFTTVTIAAGLKGGELVPTFCIGATFGCFLGGVLGLDLGLAAALGLIGIFCCATNSLISAIILGVELFGFSLIPYAVIVCIVLWLLSAKNGLLENRFFTSPFWAKQSKR